MTIELGPGTILGRYELLAPIAKGGMAQVWMARLHGSRGFHKLVAVKTILAPTKPELRSEAMLLEEARLAALIHHSNIVTTLDLGEEQGLLYLVMEWVHGETLRDVFQRALPTGGLPLQIAVNVVAQACRGLQAAHEVTSPSGVPLHLVHRDISPQNLLLSYSGVVKVADFGIAKAKVTTADLTQPGELKGKVTFMSPEQVACRPLDRRSDLFAMGTLLYLISTGHHPFRGTNTAKTLANIESCNPPKPSAIVRDFPSDLERIIEKALAADPAQRWQSAAAMFEALVDTEHGRAGQFEGALADYLQTAMGDKQRERLEFLQRCQSTSPRQPRPSAPPAAPEAQPALTTAAHSRDSHPPAAESLSPTVIRTAAGDDPPSTSTLVSTIRGRQRRRWFAGLAAGGLVGIGIVALRVQPPAQFNSEGAALAVANLSTSAEAPPNKPAANKQQGPAAAVASSASSAQNAAQTVTAVAHLIEVPTVVIESNRVVSPHELPSVKRFNSSAPPSTEPKSATGPSARKVDAWDRSQFGGRN